MDSGNLIFRNPPPQFGSVKKDYFANGSSYFHFKFEDDISLDANELNVHVVDYEKDSYIILYACYVIDRSISLSMKFASVKKYAWVLVRDQRENGTIAWNAREKMLAMTYVKPTSLYPTYRWKCYN